MSKEIGILVRNGAQVFYAYCGKARIYTECGTAEAMEYWLARGDY